jgi:hypothetical protein
MSNFLGKSFTILTRRSSYILNRQPTHALPYFLRRRRPNVFDLIRENNLFTAVRDQALLLVEFDLDLEKQWRQDGDAVDQPRPGKVDDSASRKRSIALLVDHLHSIPVRVQESVIHMVLVYQLTSLPGPPGDCFRRPPIARETRFSVLVP